MAFDYAGMQGTADELITDFGVAVTLKRNTRAAYDPQNQTATLTATTESGIGVLYPIDMRMEKGTDVRETDQTCLLSAKKPDGTEISPPLAGDALQVGADTYRIIRVKSLAPALVNLMYELVVRNG